MKIAHFVVLLIVIVGQDININIYLISNVYKIVLIIPPSS